MNRDDAIHYAIHADTIRILVIAFILTMVESAGARIVVGVCLGLGLYSAVWIRRLRNKDAPIVSILETSPVIK